MKANSPDAQILCKNNETDAVMSEKSPTLIVVDKAYGDGTAAQWLVYHLTDFNEFCGKKEKMDAWQITQLAQGIMSRFGWLKASEVMLFIYRYKMGYFGNLWGVVDPQDFMVVLAEKFIPWRARIAEEAENEKDRKERESWEKNKAKPEEIRKIIESVNKKLST